MKKLILFSVITAVFTFVSCTKNRICECENSNGTYLSGDIEGTKRQAKKSCESLSSAATKCKLK